MNSPIMVALDTTDRAWALDLAHSLNPDICRLKVGKELFTAHASIVHDLQNLGFEIFLDLKYHDIPNTTAKAVLAAADLGVFMVNVHASAGTKAMTHAADALAKGGYATKLIAVTVLTSMAQADMDEQGLGDLSMRVSLLANLAKQSGLDGVVCSAFEASAIKANCGDNFLTVCPGIRTQDNHHDQVRVATPKEALEMGADFLVMGRAITKEHNPKLALQNIYNSLADS